MAAVEHATKHRDEVNADLLFIAAGMKSSVPETQERTLPRTDRFGSNCAMQERKRHGRFTPNCGNIWTAPVPPLSANSGHSCMRSGITEFGRKRTGCFGRDDAKERTLATDIGGRPRTT